jgi:hypothetical protein
MTGTKIQHILHTLWHIEKMYDMQTFFFFDVVRMVKSIDLCSVKDKYLVRIEEKVNAYILVSDQVTTWKTKNKTER